MFITDCKNRIPLVASLLLLSLLVTGCGALLAQTQSKDDPETAALRQQALQLYREGKFVNAMPLPQGAESTGKIYFDVTGAQPTSVVYNDAVADRLIWGS